MLETSICDLKKGCGGWVIGCLGSLSLTYRHIYLDLYHLMHIYTMTRHLKVGLFKIKSGSRISEALILSWYNGNYVTI